MAREISELDRNFRPMEVADGLTWYDSQSLNVEGRGWDDTQSFFNRLPARAKGKVREPVWALSQHTAGMAIRFRTDATTITVRWEVTDESLAMRHMPASGMSGVDLYGHHEGAWRWAGCGIPEKSTTTATMGPALLAGEREYLLYLPLYNGVKSLAIGLPEGATMTSARPREGGAGCKPFVVYGTSIVQGGCASRSGMGYPEIASRMLDRPVINLGFSGNGPMDLELAELLGELDVSAYVIDSLPNMQPPMVTERAGKFVEILREARPDTPIVIVENITYQRAYLQATGTAGHELKNKLLREAYQKLLDQGVNDLHFMAGGTLLGDDGLGTVDGTHPTDLGFFRMAQSIVPILKPLV